MWARVKGCDGDEVKMWGVDVGCIRIDGYGGLGSGGSVRWSSCWWLSFWSPFLLIFYIYVIFIYIRETRKRAEPAREPTTSIE